MKVRSGLIQMALKGDTNMSPDEITKIMVEAHIPYIEDAGKKGVQVLCMQEVFTQPYFCPSQDSKWYAAVEKIPEGPTTTTRQQLLMPMVNILVNTAKPIYLMLRDFMRNFSLNPETLVILFLKLLTANWECIFVMTVIFLKAGVLFLLMVQNISLILPQQLQDFLNISGNWNSLRLQ